MNIPSDLPLFNALPPTDTLREEQLARFAPGEIQKIQENIKCLLDKMIQRNRYLNATKIARFYKKFKNPRRTAYSRDVNNFIGLKIANIATDFNGENKFYFKNQTYTQLLNKFKKEFLEDLKIYIDTSRKEHFFIEELPNVKDDFVEKANENFDYLLNIAIKKYRTHSIVPEIEKRKNNFIKEMNLTKNQNSIGYYLETNFKILIENYTGTEEKAPKYLDPSTIKKKFESLLKNIVFINDFASEFQDYVRLNLSKGIEIKTSSEQKTDDPIRLEFYLFFEFFSEFLLEKFLDRFKNKNLSSTIKKMKGVLEYAGLTHLEAKLKDKKTISIETIYTLSKEFSKIYKSSLFDRIIGKRKTEINQKNRFVEIKKCAAKLPHFKGQLPLIGQIYDRLIKSYLNPSRNKKEALVEPLDYEQLLVMLNSELVATSTQEEDDLD